MNKLLVPALALSALSTFGCFTTPPAEENRTIQMEVSAYKVPCNTLQARECLVIKEGGDTISSAIYESIDGFTFEWGFKQTLQIEKQSLPTVEDGPSFRYINRGLVRKVADTEWEYRYSAYGRGFDLEGDILRVDGYGPAIKVPDPIDRDKIVAIGEREILQMSIRPGQNGMLQARSVAILQPD